jgi:hypothetical protein
MTSAAATTVENKPQAHEEPAKATAPAKDSGSEAPGHQSPQNKMRTCNEEAKKKELKGDERRAFMSSCLKG